MLVSSRRSPTVRAVGAAILTALLLVVFTARAQAAAQPIEGTWNYGNGQVYVQATSDGQYTGTVVEPITFAANCSHPVGQAMWQISGSGTSYTGTHLWLETNKGCVQEPGGESTWKITSTGSHYALTFCTAHPGTGAPDPSATPDHAVGTTLCYALTRALAPTTADGGSGTGSGAGSGSGSAAGRSTVLVCPPARGQITRVRVGLVPLGQTRGRVRHAYRTSIRYTKGLTESYCLSGGFVRAQYRASTSKGSATYRVQWAITTNAGLHFRRVAVGTKLAVAERRLRLGTALKAHGARWYFVPTSESVVLVKVKRDVVQEMGLAKSSLATTMAARRGLLKHLS